MSNELYLVAHKVRGEPAFDVASRMECAVCHATEVDFEVPATADCHECDGTGFWWIIPTSGHRAYPWWYWPWRELACDSHKTYDDDTHFMPIIAPPMPSNLPDHYATRASVAVPSGLAALLAKRKPLNVERRGR